MEIIKNNPDYPWSLHALGENPNLTLDILNSFKINTDCFNWNTISKNPNITMNLILNNPTKPWIYSQISENPNLTIKILKTNPTKQWDWNKISCNKNITKNDILNNHTLKWNWKYVSKNPNVPIDFILNNNMVDWRYVSHNPNLTMNFILNNLDKKWDWNAICQNEFNYDRNNYVNACFKKILLANGLNKQNKKLTLNHILKPKFCFKTILFNKNIVKKIITY